jgi:hypothetical protein
VFSEGVLDTATIAKWHKKGKRNRFAVPNTLSLDLPNQDLPMDPYLLGLWLGDGSSTSATLTIHGSDRLEIEANLLDRDIHTAVADVRGETYSLRLSLPGQVQPGRGECRSVYSQITSLGLLKNKHVPPQYLRMGREQRLELLRGLMDTDGSITTRGRASFHNTKPHLVQAVEDLAHSLGLKTRTRWRKPSRGVLQSGQTIEGKLDIAEVSFVAYADTPVFNLMRKRDRQPERADARSSETERRRIVRVTPVDAVPVQCLTR